MARALPYKQSVAQSCRVSFICCFCVPRLSSDVSFDGVGESGRLQKVLFGGPRAFLQAWLDPRSRRCVCASLFRYRQNCTACSGVSLMGSASPVGSGWSHGQQHMKSEANSHRCKQSARKCRDYSTPSCQLGTVMGGALQAVSNRESKEKITTIQQRTIMIMER